MASVTIRNLEDDLKVRLRLRAALHGRSMEEELRVILRAELARPLDEVLDLAPPIRHSPAP